MLILRIWNFFRGYVLFRLEGLNLERTLNLAIEDGIYLWDIRRINYTTIEGKVGGRGYKELRKVLKKTGCRSKIKMKIGFPFFIFKLKRKKIVAVGLVLSVLLIIGFTSFVWDVEIQGNNNVSKREILESLESIGVKAGVFKYTLNKSEIKDGLLITHDRLAWVGVEVKGTKIRIEVVEKDERPEKVEKDTPCHIVATKNGVIEKIIAKSGDAAVKKGDIVKQNQILIDGKIEREGLPPRFVHSMGEVYARTYYEKSKVMPIYKVKKIKTGRKFTRRIFKIGDTSFTVSKGSVPFDKYVIEVKNKSLTKWRNIKFPVEIVIEQYFEIVEQKKKVPEDVIRKSLKDFLLVNVIKDIPEDGKIIKRSIDYKKQGSVIKGHLIVEVLESIGMEKIFSIHEEE
ncbi:sporulation protein YqfD [Wukongibacter baidiensis]|uniref:sporulation protein YqfD n=1 Tax=Wukongibacter baidiensis TaxID=1723361 RepID=UPI003D7F916E